MFHEQDDQVAVALVDCVEGVLLVIARIVLIEDIVSPGAPPVIEAADRRSTSSLNRL